MMHTFYFSAIITWLPNCVEFSKNTSTSSAEIAELIAGNKKNCSLLKHNFNEKMNVKTKTHLVCFLPSNRRKLFPCSFMRLKMQMLQNF